MNTKAKEALKKPILDFLEEELIEKYNRVKENPNPNKEDIKALAYTAIAYFQCLNFIQSNKAVKTYKNLFLPDNEKGLTYKISTSIKKFLKRLKGEIEPIDMSSPHFNSLLKDVNSILINYKDIVKKIKDKDYEKYLKETYDLKPYHITVFHMLDMLYHDKEIKARYRKP